MSYADLASLAAQLRAEGFDARNLGKVGITVWEEGRGQFFPADELSQLSGLVARREFQEILRKREK